MFNRRHLERSEKKGTVPSRQGDGPLFFRTLLLILASALLFLAAPLAAALSEVTPEDLEQNRRLLEKIRSDPDHYGSCAAISRVSTGCVPKCASGCVSSTGICARNCPGLRCVSCMRHSSMHSGFRLFPPRSGKRSPPPRRWTPASNKSRP